ncbi:hypothetical protein MSA92_05860, partial [bacterium]|nr:hypothetical protein [bacterium]
VFPASTWASSAVHICCFVTVVFSEVSAIQMSPSIAMNLFFIHRSALFSPKKRIHTSESSPDGLFPVSK